LPSYQAFNRRLNRLGPAFALLLQDALRQAEARLGGGSDRLLDSLPVILARGSRGDAARVARGLAAKGYCASKRLYYHGLKLHLVARKRDDGLPVPESLVLMSAAVHDLTAFQQRLPMPEGGALFGDKAYGDAQTRAALAARRVTLCTPEKRPLRQPGWQPGLWSRFVSAMRQPVESCFNWLIQRAGIQDASKVRSTDGLLVHCYGKLTVCCLLLLFNS
jgi:Transposase DDE domain